MRIPILLVVALLPLAGAAVTPVNPTDQRIAALEEALKQQPANAQVQVSLALAYLQKVRETVDYGYLDRASAIADKLLEKDSGNNEALRVRDEIDMQKHEFRRVAETAADLTKLLPSDPGNWANLGDALMELGRYNDAEKAYARMVTLRPTIESYTRIAWYRFVTGKPDEAIKFMQMGVTSGSRTQENLAWCWTELGDMYFRTGKSDLARDAYANALKLFPRAHRALAGAARLVALHGETDAAIGLYQRAQSIVPLIEYSHALEQLYAAKHDEADAKKERDLIDVTAKLAEARGEKANRLLALIYVDENRNTDKAVRLAEAELENRGDVYTWDALGWVYLKAKRLADAEKMAAKAIALNTPDPQLYFHAGMIASAAGKRDEAKRLLSRALELNAEFDLVHAPEAKAELARLTAVTVAK